MIDATSFDPRSCAIADDMTQRLAGDICADCGHRRSLHIDDDGECDRPDCECVGFVA